MELDEATIKDILTELGKRPVIYVACIAEETNPLGIATTAYYGDRVQVKQMMRHLSQWLKKDQGV